MAPLPTIYLAPRKARPTWHGHPWIRKKAIAKVVGEPACGDIVRVCDDAGRTIDHALWSPASSIPARTLGVGKNPRPFDELLAERLARAIQTRADSNFTLEARCAFRLVNSEGDFLPGLVVDAFDRVAVVLLTTAAMHARADAIIDQIRALPGPGGAPWFSKVALRSDPAMARREGYEPRDEVYPTGSLSEVEIVEHGVLFTVSPGELQKTGHYADQRELRVRFGCRAPQRRALDLHCFTGGFALHAARAGAASVVGVDSSKDAIERARQNAERNGLEPGRVMFERDKVERWLDTYASQIAQGRAVPFDLVSLDPPKLAKSRREHDRALDKMVALCAQSMRVMADDAVLMVASCSSAFGATSLLRAVAAAAAHHDVGRLVQTLEVHQQPADHPYPPAMPEGQYLTSIVVRVSR